MTTTQTTQPAFLREMWPLFILGRQGEGSAPLLDRLCPATPEALRDTFRPVFVDTNPTAAQGLDASEDGELAYWCRVLRGPLLTGNPDELTFLPDWLTVDGVMLTEVARLLTLPLCERMDVFLAAMHRKGQA